MAAFAKLLTTELKTTLRDGPTSLVAVVFPAVVVAFFGVITDPAADPMRFFYQPMSVSMGVGVLAFSLMATEMATYRERGILRRLAVTPVGPSRLLGAQLVINLGIAAACVAAVVCVGTLGFGFPLPGHAPAFLVTVALGLAALLAIGLFIAAISPTSRAATGVGVAFYFANLVLGGVFFPKDELPEALAKIGDVTPLGAMLQALRDSWSGHWPQPINLIVLAGCATLFGALAVRLFRW